MQEKIIILDFGSQYTQLIARRVREQNVYCEIIPFSKKVALDDSVKGVIFSGSPFSVMQDEAPDIDVLSYFQQKPVLAICYGAQLIAKNCGGKVEKSATREYGRAHLLKVISDDQLVNQMSDHSQIWMSHGDTITALPENFELVAKSESMPTAVYRSKKGQFNHQVYALQFHPEVYHTTEGASIIQAYLFAIAKEYEADAQVEKALDCYAQLVVKYPNYVGTYYHYASLLQEQDKKTEASSIIERGIEICTIQGDRHAASELAFLLETEED